MAIHTDLITCVEILHNPAALRFGVKATFLGSRWPPKGTHDSMEGEGLVEARNSGQTELNHGLG
jgi:hypothetical protein